jgi:hypothetical protein
VKAQPAGFVSRFTSDFLDVTWARRLCFSGRRLSTVPSSPEPVGGLELSPRALYGALAARGRSLRALRHSAGRLVAPTALATVLGTATVSVVLSGAAEQPSTQAWPWHAASVAAAGTGARVASSVSLLRRESVSRAVVRPSRSAPRVTLKPRVSGHEWSTDHLNVWLAPREQGRRVGLIDPAKRLPVTGRVVGHWAEIVVKDDQTRWVNADYLSKDKPDPVEAAAADAATGGLSSAPCPDGSSVESGITSTAVGLYRAACAAFPALTTYGGYDAHGEHADGRAIDFMTGDSGTGTALAEWARANASALGVRTIIWQQRIWTPERSAEGWRGMSDRGSATANHYDHVHISVY